MTRARQWQIKQHALGNCVWCGKPAGGFNRCAIHREWFRQYSKKWRERKLDENRAKERTRKKLEWQRDPIKNRLKGRIKYAKNIEKSREQARASRSRNIGNAHSRDRARQPRRTTLKRKRYQSDPSFRLASLLRSRIVHALRAKRSVKSEGFKKAVGCSLENLMIYLESRFKTGMSWENYGSVWHVDHIIPCALFDLSRPEHQIACFHFSNLQPLFAQENFAKSDHLLPGFKAPQ